MTNPYMTESGEGLTVRGQKRRFMVHGAVADRMKVDPLALVRDSALAFRAEGWDPTLTWDQVIEDVEEQVTEISDWATTPFNDLVTYLAQETTKYLHHLTGVEWPVRD